MARRKEREEREMALQYVMYMMMASYFENSKKNLQIASPYEEDSLKLAYCSLKKNTQDFYEDNVLSYIENHIIDKDVTDSMLRDHAIVRFKDSWHDDNDEGESILIGVEFDAYIWSLEFTARMTKKGEFNFTHRVLKSKGNK